MGHMGGGMGGMRGGGFGGGGFRGGFGGGGFRGGFGGWGFRGGFNRGFGFRGNRFVVVNRRFGFGNGFIGAGVWGWPSWGWGGGAYWPGDYVDSGYGAYPPYYTSGSSPNVTVVYPPAQLAAAPVYADQVAVGGYDEYGQPVGSSRGVSASNGSPIYLIALKNQNIYPAVAYSVKVDTLSFLTIWREQKMVPLDWIDRGFTMQLNRERHVNFQLP
jgi:hypothetical protein